MPLTYVLHSDNDCHGEDSGIRLNDPIYQGVIPHVIRCTRSHVIQLLFLLSVCNPCYPAVILVILLLSLLSGCYPC